MQQTAHVFTADHPIEKKKMVKPFRLNPQDENILLALNRFHLLTAEHICGLLYSKGSIKFVKAKLKALRDAQYVESYSRPRFTTSGNLPRVYRLGQRGIPFLQNELGVDVGFRPRK